MRLMSKEEKLIAVPLGKFKPGLNAINIVISRLLKAE